LWPEALLDIGTMDQTEGLKVIGSMARAWTPDRAQHNYMRSLETLDWRLRFKTIAQALDARSLKLDTELARLTKAIRSAQPAGTVR
jgi:hypothetical protein